MEVIVELAVVDPGHHSATPRRWAGSPLGRAVSAGDTADPATSVGWRWWSGADGPMAAGALGAEARPIGMASPTGSFCGHHV